MRLTRFEMESRRLYAADDLRAGMANAAVARKYGVSRQSAFRWKHMLQDGADLLRRRAPGRPRLVPRESVEKVLRQHPELPNTKLVGAVHEKTGVRYDPDHLGRIRKAMLERAHS